MGTIKSDIGLVNGKVMQIETATNSMSNLGDVADVAEDTTTGKKNCRTLYSNGKNIVANYLTNATRDSQRIKKIGVSFETLDEKIKNVMVGNK